MDIVAKWQRNGPSVKILAMNYYWRNSIVIALGFAVLPGAAFGQDSMFGSVRSFLSSFLETKPTPPEPFGLKTGWIAVRSADVRAVADSLPLRSQTPANWHDGLEAAYKGGSVFITPPVNGWICVVGGWATGTGERQSFDSMVKIVSGLSSRFGEAHGYATHRVIEYHHWILAKQGRVLRCFAYIGETGELLCQSGEVTGAEKKLRFANQPPDQWMPDEQDVLKIAAGWSFDPSKLSSVSAAAVNGILATVVAR